MRWEWWEESGVRWERGGDIRWAGREGGWLGVRHLLIIEKELGH